MKHWLLRCAIGLAAMAAPAHAQIPETPLFRQLGAAEGLPSDHVYALAQDRAGHLWVATGDGLARFDGVSFRVWQHDPRDPRSLPGNVIQALHIDAQDRIWVGAEGGGLSRMDSERAGFRHYNAKSDPRFALDDVFAIASTPDGALWFGGYGGGLYRYVPESDTVEVFRHDAKQSDSLAGDLVLALEVDDEGQVWIGTTAGLDRFDHGRFRHQAGLSGTLALSLYAEPQGPLWIGGNKGLEVRERDGSVRVAVAREALSNSVVAAVLRDRRGTHWIGTRAGLNHLVDGQVRRYLGRTERRYTLATASMFDALEDHEGGLWFAAVGAGLQRLPPNWRNFAVLVAGDAAEGGLSTDFPRGFAESQDGALWVVGAFGTLDRVERDGRVSRHLEGALTDSQLWSVAEDARGQVWIGHYTGLTRYDRKSGDLVTWKADSPSDPVPPGTIDLLLLAPDGSLWLAANGGGIQHRSADGRVENTFEPGPTSGLQAPDTEALEWGPDDTLWIAGAGGLHRFDPALGFQSVPGSPTERVFGFAFDGNEGVWLQRLGALEHYRLDAGKLRLIERVDAERGMPAVEAGGLRIDAAGAVWVTSTRGLFRYRPDRGELRRFGLRDGLPSTQFGNKPPLRTREGAIVAGTIDGMVWFDPRRLEEDRNPPRLHFEGVRVQRGGKRLSLDYTQPVLLQHDDRELRVSARLLSFADPQSHRYRFRLRGYEPDWLDREASGERVFSQLPPGDYTLQVVAANAEGVWSAPPLSLPITVASPWWATRQAYAGYAFATVLAMALLFLLMRARLKRRHAIQLKKQQHEWALRASEAKSSFLATLGHEIRTPMTGVLGMTELLLRTPLGEAQRDYATTIQQSGQLMLRLVNDALDLARIEAGRLELADAPIDLHALLREVAALLRPLAEAKELGFHLSIAAEAPRAVRGDALRIKQILLNLGNNALKFTERGEVEIGLQGEANAGGGRDPVLRVRDTGPGLNEEQRARLFRRFSQADGAQTTQRYGGSGLGLAISQELAAAMGGRIAVQSEPGVGTTFEVHLPLPACELPTAAVADSAPAECASGSCRVLLVEDDPTVAAVVSGLLAAQGHTVVHAAHGLAALTELHGAGFDLAFLDLDLPGVNGVELARMIRAQGHRLPLIALTARADAAAEPQAREAGMSGFLRKPVTGLELASAIAEAQASTLRA